MLQTGFIEVDGERITHHYLCHYRPWAYGFDKLSKSLIQFKNKYLIDVEAWVSCSVEYMSEFENKSPLVLRALQADELQVSQSTNLPLDLLGRELSRSLGGWYKPWLLTKERITRPAKTLTRKEREMELRNVYFFQEDTGLARSILIIDDILTTGFTMAAIIRSIRAKSRGIPIQLFTLACTDSEAKLNSTVDLRGDQFTWQDKGWNRVREDPHGYGGDLSELKRLIHSNFSFQE
ncbi:MAG: hypothetical protein ABL895_19350 [Cyclobacteriaceae bacterium]